MDLYDEIYYSLIGELDPALSWVPNAFSEGSPCQEGYSRMMAAKQRMLERLGAEEDRDVEEILYELQSITHHLCREIMELRQL